MCFFKIAITATVNSSVHYFVNFSAIGTISLVLDSTFWTILTANNFVWTRSRIWALDTVKKVPDQTTSRYACLLTLNKEALRPLIELKWFTCSPFWNVNSTFLSVCNCSVLFHMITQVLTITPTSVFETTSRSTNMRSIFILVSDDGLTTYFHWCCTTCL